MSEIKKVAVIGSGVMGSAIAAHIANSGTPVILYDIVPEGATDRTAIAKGAIERLLKANPAPLTHPRNAKRITPANLEDDLEHLKEVDWIIEAVLERLDIKHGLYEKIEPFRKKGSIISSNTSTLPLHELEKGLPKSFAPDFMITHFFNPPRYMRLLELVRGKETRPEALEIARQFCDVRLGKGVVDCKDTPGFIANRIGCFWMTAGLVEALKMGISVEEADLVMSRPIGVPKTGVFGLLDLIGIDLLPLIGKSMLETLPKKDAFRDIYEEPKLVTKMIADGYTGRKGKGGFYRLNTEGGKKVKEAINLQDGSYATAARPRLESADAAKAGLRALVEHADIGGKYAWTVLSQTLSYTASLIPEIADDIRSVDDAMRMGYNWKYGPFELIDKLGGKDMAGPKWLAEKLASEGKPVPELLVKAGDKPFYEQTEKGKTYLHIDGSYKQEVIDESAWMLADKKIGQKPIMKNPSAALWDVGDGIACFEYTSKMNSQDPLSLELLAKATEEVSKNFKGMIIGNDSDNFCVGANIGFLLLSSNVAAWKTVEQAIRQGQETYMGLKYSPFPVVTAPTGMALGGGCEVLLHSDAVQAHIELYTGLVEVGVGVVPGWGGCKEMLLRHSKKRLKSQKAVAKMGHMFSFISPIKTLNTMPVIQGAFEQIALAKVSKSAEQARDMLILRETDGITMNRRRLLADAKAKCLELAKDYRAPDPEYIHLPGKTAKTALEMGINAFVKSGKATAHDEVVSKALAEVLSGGDTSIGKALSEKDILELEVQHFMQLIKTKGTLDRIEYMLDNGKPLRN